jgi:hypothetical protein
MELLQSTHQPASLHSTLVSLFTRMLILITTCGQALWVRWCRWRGRGGYSSRQNGGNDKHLHPWGVSIWPQCNPSFSLGIGSNLDGDPFYSLAILTTLAPRESPKTCAPSHFSLFNWETKGRVATRAGPDGALVFLSAYAPPSLSFQRYECET